MKATTVLAVGLAVALWQPAGAQTDPDPWSPHRSLKILYAGKQDGHREKVFAAFLGKWFDQSATIPLERLSTTTAADYDLVIVDWVSQYGNDGYPSRDNSLFGAPTTLGPDFTKPMISMTYVSTQVRRGYKLDWL